LLIAATPKSVRIPSRYLHTDITVCVHHDGATHTYTHTHTHTLAASPKLISIPLKCPHTHIKYGVAMMCDCAS